MKRVVTAGETMGLLRATSIGTLEHLTSLDVAIGGAESNVAIGLARLHVPVTWLGVVGDDGIGRRVLKELRGQGVDVAARVTANLPTAVMLKEHPLPGTTRVTYHRSSGAGPTLSVTDLAQLDLSDAGLIHLTGITPALSESAAEAARALVMSARELGIDVSFDVNHRSTLWQGRDPSSTYRWFVERSDVVFAGLEEGEFVVGAIDPERMLHALADLGPQEVVVKLGADGAMSLCAGEILVQPAVPVTAVDSVGAGDAFVAGYLAERMLGKSPIERLQTAVAAGALACLSPGDWEGTARREDLGRLIVHSDPVAR